MWTLRAYIANQGTDVLHDWYDEHAGDRWVSLLAQYAAIWLHLRQQPWNGWVGSYYHPLTGKEGVGRIGFQHKRIAYRHLGFRSGEAEFTLLLTAEEHSHVYLPKGCMDVAVTRMKAVQANRALARNATIRVPPENV
jgi:hypothetical protein